MNVEEALRLAGLKRDKNPPTFCSRCGQELTDPESVARGIGPICAEKEMRKSEETSEENDEC